jgi:hypothetical protein
VHRDLEAVAEVDVHDLAAPALEEQVGRVPVAEPEDVPDHAAHRERARVRRAPLEPVLRVRALHPQHPVQVLPGRVLERVLEHLDLLQQRQLLVVRRHLASRVSVGPHLAVSWRFT